MLSKTAEQAQMLLDAVYTAKKAFDNVSYLGTPAMIEVEVGTPELLQEIRGILSEQGFFVLHVPPSINSSSNVVTEQALSFGAGVAFIFRRPATNEEIQAKLK